MSKQTRNSNSRSTAATAVKATGVSEDGVGTTSTTSDPSGLRAPDGTNPPPKSGDAAGEASADLVKPQVNSEYTEAAKVEAENRTPAPNLEASALGDMSADHIVKVEPSANAGSVEPVFNLEGILIATGTASFDDLLYAASLGKRTVSLIEEIVAIFPELDRETPAEIIEALLEEATALMLAADHAASIGRTTGTSSENAIEQRQPGASHPLTKAVLDNWDEARAPVIRITSKEAGFFRGGIRHPAQATDYPIRTLSPDQLENILGEALLIVELV